MNPQEMVVLIIAIVMIANVLKSRHRHRGRLLIDDQEPIAPPPPETARLRDEVQHLKQRIQVLERIAVEKENSLERQIEELRDR